MNEKDRLSEDAIANKRRYDAEYLKENYKQIHISLPKEDVIKIKKLVRSKGFTMAEFMRICIKMLEQDKIKKED